MTLLIDQTFERTLDRLLATYATPDWRGASLDAWLFEDAGQRRAAEARFRAAGVDARLHPAYKPLIGFFVEDARAAGPFTWVELGYPVVPDAGENRFRLEAYPLAGMIGDARLDLVPEAVAAGAMPAYRLRLEAADGSLTDLTLPAPNHLAEDHIGQMRLSPTGWLKLAHPDGRRIDQRLETEYEALFHRAMAVITAWDWGADEPFFETLEIRVDLPGADTRLPVGEEVISLHEALHEELYFSLLEHFQRHSGRPIGARDLQPGRILPDIRSADGTHRLRIETRPLDTGEADWPDQPLHEAEAPFGMAQIRAELDRIGGEVFVAGSRAGRPVLARHRQGSDHPVMISGGQHANEVSGVAGAIRAAALLAARPTAHFTIAPVENPDGYAMHRRLTRSQPDHMHHAARYTALGDDLEYRRQTERGLTGPLYEAAIRVEARARTGADLHLNLHGYPSHEWTRPLTGYVPRGFEMWTVPKGFFLILRHHPGWEDRARRLLTRVTAELARLPDLAALNARQIALYEIHAGRLGFEVIDGFPCMVSEQPAQVPAVTLITEYPDETVYGAAFRLAHDAQTRAVLAAYDAWQEIMTGAG